MQASITLCIRVDGRWNNNGLTQTWSNQSPTDSRRWGEMCRSNQIHVCSVELATGRSKCGKRVSERNVMKRDRSFESEDVQQQKLGMTTLMAVLEHAIEEACLVVKVVKER